MIITLVLRRPGTVRTGVALALLGLMSALVDGMGPSFTSGNAGKFAPALDACRDAWLSLSAYAYGDAYSSGGVDTGDAYRSLLSQACLKIVDRIATHHPGAFFFTPPSTSGNGNRSANGGGDGEVEEHPAMHAMLRFALDAVAADYQDNLTVLFSGANDGGLAKGAVVRTTPTGTRYAVQCLFRLAGFARGRLATEQRLSHLLLHVLDSPATLKVCLSSTCVCACATGGDTDWWFNHACVRIGCAGLNSASGRCDRQPTALTARLLCCATLLPGDS